MFSVGHVAWIGICALLIAAGVTVCCRLRPSLDRVLKISLGISVVSETVKILCVMRIVPMVAPAVSGGELVYRETGTYSPYMELGHLPLELCSLQLFFLVLALVMRPGKWRARLFALMYFTCILGGGMGIVFAAIAPEYPTAASFFCSLRPWQYFPYHAMLVVLGIWLGLSRESGITFRHIRFGLIGIVLLDAASFYLNSVFSVPVYHGGDLMGLGYRVNFFSSYWNPLGIAVTQKWQWLAYLGIRAVLAVGLIVLVFLPLRWKRPLDQDDSLQGEPADQDKDAVPIGMIESRCWAAFPYAKLEIFIPESHLPALREALQQADAGHIGRYDSCLSFHPVTGTWRPLRGTCPYLGKAGEVSCEPEVKVEVTVRSDRLRETAAAVRAVHPYEEPVINAIPLLGTGLDL